MKIFRFLKNRWVIIGAIAAVGYWAYNNVPAVKSMIDGVMDTVKSMFNKKSA